MTLIVGFWCGDSAVVCADSQETYGGLKTEVNKLPIGIADRDGMDIVCGGAGNGDLSDAFRQRLFPQAMRSSARGETAVRQELEAALVSFHQSDVFVAYPGSPDDKRIAGLIAVRSAAKEVFLFEFFGPVIQRVETYGLAGEEYPFFERVAKQRYRAGLSVHQAVLIGVDVINEAKHGSVYVGGPTRVVIATPNEGMQTQDQARIAWTEMQIATQNQLFDDLRFDLSSTSAQADERLRSFSNSITSMRGVYGSKYPAWPVSTLDIKRSDHES